MAARTQIGCLINSEWRKHPEEAEDAAKKLAAALLEVSRQTKTKVRMMAALEVRSR